MRIASYIILIGILLSLSQAQVGAAETTYRCPQADGSVEYTTHPCADGDGEVVELPVMNTFDSRPNPRPATGGDQNAQTDDAAAATPTFEGYSVLEIVDPTPEKLYVNIGGELDVVVRVSPRLQPGHGIMLYLDGEAVVSRPQSGTAFHLTEVWPVVHTVRAEILNAEGGVEVTSRDVQFFVRQRHIN